jgi:predicted GIY-YIG superfamily endonuclease
MFYAYVIKSVNRNYYYKGHCEDPEIRLQQHNAGYSKVKRECCGN